MSPSRKKREVHPEGPLCQPLDGSLDELLEMMQSLRQEDDDDDDWKPGRTSRTPEETVEAVAVFELSVACRGFELTGGPYEPTPLPLAMRLLDTAIVARDGGRAAKMLSELSPAGLWQAHRRIRQIEHQGARIWMLATLLWNNDVVAYGLDLANERAHRLKRSGMDDDALESYLELCINSGLGQLLLRLPKHVP
jgi:hypothetical protein